MISVTNSFLWLGLFSKFANLGIDDKKFVEFMIEFENNMRDRKVDVTFNGVKGMTFNELCINPETKKSRATKDKTIVVPKMELLEKLMLDYLHINKEDLEEINTLDFVKENVNPDADEEYINECNDLLEDLKVEVDNSSSLFNEHNIPSLIALMGYSLEQGVMYSVLKKWWINFFDRNNTYELNQKRNLDIMVQSLHKAEVA